MTRLTNTEFAQKRERLGFTQAALAAFLDVPLRTLEAWEQDTATINARQPNRIACRVLDWIEQGKLKR